MFQKILDTITIVFPALVAVLGLVNLTGLIPYFETAEQVILIVLGAISTIASIWYNKVLKK